MTNIKEDLQISVRDLFEASALAGLIAHDGFNNNTVEKSKIIAESMLEARAYSEPELWLDAPEWANFRAKDEDGGCFYFEVKPSLKDFAWTAQPNTLFIEAPVFAFDGAWQESLQSRGES